MGLFIRESEKKAYPLIKSGRALAICYQVIDLGTHHDDKFDKDQRRVLLAFELPQIRMDFEKDGVKTNKARVISRQFTMALSDRAHLYNFLVSWRGKDLSPEERKEFDLKTLLGKAGELKIIHKISKSGKTYANIKDIEEVAEGTSVPTPENPLVFFSLDDLLPGEPLPTIPDWISGIITTSHEWQQLNGIEGSAATEIDDDNIAF